MMNWWRGREDNERRLMLVAGALLGILVIVQMLVTPLRAGNDTDKSGFESSVRSLRVVRTELGAAKLLVADEQNGNSLNTDTLRSATTGLALERGLSVSRIQTGIDGKVTVSLEDADPRLVYAWLADVESKIGASIMRVSIARGQSGLIQVVVDFKGGV